jgi:hypothetical protein
MPRTLNYRNPKTRGPTQGGYSIVLAVCANVFSFMGGLVWAKWIYNGLTATGAENYGRWVAPFFGFLIFLAQAFCVAISTGVALYEREDPWPPRLKKWIIWTAAAGFVPPLLAVVVGSLKS